MLPIGQCQVLPPLCPLQAETTVIGRQSTGDSLWVYNWQEPVVADFPASPHSMHIPHLCSQGPSTYEAIVSDHPKKSMVLMRCDLPWSPCCLAWHQSSSSSIPLEDAVDSCVIRIISKNWEKMYNCWFELATVWRQISGNAHLSCGFGLRRSHLALKWKSGQGKVSFSWGAVTGTFHVNFSPLEKQTCYPKQFYCLKSRCNNHFVQECI